MSTTKQHCLTNSDERSKVTNALEELAHLVGMRFVLDESKVQNINSIVEEDVSVVDTPPSKAVGA